MSKVNALWLFSGKADFENLEIVEQDLNQDINFTFWPIAPSDLDYCSSIKERVLNIHNRDIPQNNSSGAADAQAKTISAPTNPAPTQKLSLKQRLLRLPVIDVFRYLAIAVVEARDLKNQKKIALEKLKQHEIQVIITSQERHPKFLAILAAASELKIPVILIPSNFLCMPDGGAYMRKDRLRLYTDKGPAAYFRDHIAGVWLLNKLIGHLWPSHVFKSRWGDMLCFPAQEMLAQAFAAMLPKNTWFQGTRFVDRVVISGYEEQLVCRYAGITDDKISFIGNPIFEKIMDIDTSEIKENYLKNNYISGQKRIAIFAIPVPWEHKMITKEMQFSALEMVLEKLHAQNVDIIFSLHPKSSIQDYLGFAQKYNAHISEEPLSHILPMGDMFIAGAYSSTIRWAMALNIPSVNIDFWSLEDSTYKDIKEFPTIRNIDEFETWLNSSVIQQNQDRFAIMAEKGFNDRLLQIIKSCLAENC